MAAALLDLGRLCPDRLACVLFQLDGQGQAKEAPANSAPVQAPAPRRVKTLTVPMKALACWFMQLGPPPAFVKHLPDEFAVIGCTLHTKQHEATLLIEAPGFPETAEGQPVPAMTC
jgi:hypothetical protein